MNLTGEEECRLSVPQETVITSVWRCFVNDFMDPQSILYGTFAGSDSFSVCCLLFSNCSSAVLDSINNIRY